MLPLVRSACLFSLTDCALSLPRPRAYWFACTADSSARFPWSHFYLRKPKVNSECPAAIETYWAPSTMYVIGEAATWLPR